MTIRASMIWWYISLLAVRGPLPADSAAIPNKTPPSGIKLAIIAVRHSTGEWPNTAAIPHTNAARTDSPQLRRE